MIKAKEFLEYLCNDLGFRFFSGVPCTELIPVYNEMNSKLLHYIPAANETIAVGISSGTWLTEFKSGVFMDSNKIGCILPILYNINFRLKIPILFVFGGDNPIVEIKTVVLKKNYKHQIEELLYCYSTEGLPVGITIKEGFLS